MCKVLCVIELPDDFNFEVVCKRIDGDNAICKIASNKKSLEVIYENESITEEPLIYICLKGPKSRELSMDVFIDGAKDNEYPIYADVKNDKYFFMYGYYC